MRIDTHLCAHSCQSGSRVLVVNDQEHIVRMLTPVLTRQGYRVQAAVEGQSALAHLHLPYFTA